MADPLGAVSAPGGQLALAGARTGAAGRRTGRDGTGGGPGEQPGLAQPRDHALAEPVRLLEVGLARQDEVVEAELVVLGDALGDLVVAADQRGAGAAAHEAEAGPEVGRDDEVVAAPAVQRRHAVLADRLARRRACCCALATTSGGMASSRRSVSAQASSARSRVMTCRRMPKRDLAPGARRPAPGPRATCWAATSGGSPHISHTSAWWAATRLPASDDPPKKIGGRGSGGGRHGGALDPVVLAVEVERACRSRRPARLQELGGAVVALVVVEPVAEAALLLAAAAGHDVEQQPAAATGAGTWRPAGRRASATRSPGRKATRNRSRVVSRMQRRGRDPGVLAPRAGRREHRVEADLLGRLRHLGQVVEVGLAAVPRSGRSRRRRGCRRRWAGTSGRRAARRTTSGSGG